MRSSDLKNLDDTRTDIQTDRHTNSQLPIL